MLPSQSETRYHTGKVESVFVSVAEAWQVERFIEAYLELRGYQLTESNRFLLTQQLEAAPGRPPYRIESLVSWLDEKYKHSRRTLTPKLGQ
ncbi:hypothetical protein EC919_11511 [Pseudomonas graminis]|nr:hypothetical protein EC919_11511 [Pseudomonas graminis]